MMLKIFRAVWKDKTLAKKIFVKFLVVFGRQNYYG